MEITVLGLQQAGKTTFVNLIADSPPYEDTIPTIGFNMRRIRKRNVIIKVWDLGGEKRFRGMWERYCRGINAIVYIVDAADDARMEESKFELHYLLGKRQLANIPLLVLGNKTDLATAVTETEMIDIMDLESIVDREVCCYMVSCRNNRNIDVTLQWLIAHAKHT